MSTTIGACRASPAAFNASPTSQAARLSKEPNCSRCSCRAMRCMSSAMSNNSSCRLSSLGATEDRPLHAELLSEVSVLIAPELPLERHRHASFGGQKLEQPFRVADAMALDQQRAALHRFRVGTVRRVEAKRRPLEERMQDLGGPGAAVAPLHRRSLVAPEVSDAPKPAGSVEFERGFAVAFEVEIRGELHRFLSDDRRGARSYAA